MYSDAEIESAIASGKLRREAADALREHASDLRATPNADEEQFRLITSFNDIFVAIAGALVLVATGWLGGIINLALGGVAVAAVSWALAEFFTRRRRMAFPSIVFFFAFTFGVNLAARALLGVDNGGLLATDDKLSRDVMISLAVSYAVLLGAIYAHWRRFNVPISIAAAVGSVAALIFSLAVAAIPAVGQWMLAFALVLGLGIFAFAMWWDVQDRDRTTRRSDVAFWLHLLASPMIVHPVFVMLGLNFLVGGRSIESSASVLAVVAIGFYFVFGLIALVIDRRAFLVSALIYVLAATVYLFSRTDIQGTGIAVAALIIGSGLLMLSTLWQKLRAQIVPLMPTHWQSLLPALNRSSEAST